MSLLYLNFNNITQNMHALVLYSVGSSFKFSIQAFSLQFMFVFIYVSTSDWVIFISKMRNKFYCVFYVFGIEKVDIFQAIFKMQKRVDQLTGMQISQVFLCSLLFFVWLMRNTFFILKYLMAFERCLFTPRVT